MKKLAPWLLTAVLLLGAWCATFWTPTEEEITAPFIVEAEIGEPAIGRDIAVTITSVQISDGVFIAAEPDDGDEWTEEEPKWLMPGSWVILTLDAQSNISQVGSTIQRAVLVIDGRTYWADERMPSLADSVSLVPGVPLNGNFAFEVPAEARESTGKFHISLNFDERVDSVIELAVDLSAIPIEDEVEIVKTDWTNR